MYVKLYSKTRFSAVGYFGGAMQMDVIDESASHEKVILTKTITGVDENSSVTGLSLLINAISRIRPGSINRIELMDFDGKNSYLSSAVCYIRKWVSNGFRSESTGELLKNADLISDLNEVLVERRLKTTKGEIDLPIIILQESSPADLKLKSKLSKMAQKAGVDEIRLHAKTSGEVFYSEIKVAN